MTALLAIAALLAADAGHGKERFFTSKSGLRWRVTQTAGAVPEPGYEQSYQRLDQLGAKDEVVLTLNFEERAWVRPDGVERTWVEFSLDARGELQAVQHALTEPKDKSKPRGKESVTTFRWNGKGFDRLEGPR